MTLKTLSDSQLIQEFRELVIEEQTQLVLHLDYLIELDRRKLHFEHSSLWAYLVHELGMEEWTAERRIRAARLMARIPGVRNALESGKLNLSLIEIAQACAQREKLPDEGLVQLLDVLQGKSCKGARKEVAKLYPRSAEDIPHDRVRPLNDELSEIRFVASEELLAQLEEVKGLLAHSHPGASFAAAIGILAAEFLKRHHPEKKAERAKPSPATLQVETRTPSASITHAVVREKGYQCSYIDPKTNKRCVSHFALEKHHDHSWHKGGATSLENLQFLCPSHHRRLSFLEFGEYTKFHSLHKRE